MIEFLLKLSDRTIKDNILEKLSQQFVGSYNLLPYFGVELEFYLSDNVNILELENVLKTSIKLERGRNQYEIILPPSADLINYSRQILEMQNNIKTAAKFLGGKANLEPKPFLDDYGNSMQFNISFKPIEKLDNRLSPSTHENNEQLVEHIAKSLCHFMLETFIIYMPEEKDYLRIDQRFMAPTHLSYGGNNRTTAIRIPDTIPKRIEHRISSMSADPILVMLTILKSILLGFQRPEKISKFTKIYGNAFSKEYNLIPLPKNRLEACRLFRPSFFDNSF